MHKLTVCAKLCDGTYIVTALKTSKIAHTAFLLCGTEFSVKVYVPCFTLSVLYRKTEQQLWIGLHDKTNESAFEWVDGTPVG